jgi:hypothetical protein
MAEVRMSLEEYLTLIEKRPDLGRLVRKPTVSKAPKRPRKASAYSKRYGAAFKRLQKRYKTKGGAWRKGGFKACQKAAHKAAKK